jgi:hypothetical protein
VAEDPRPQWAAEAFGHRLTQPDRRSCGATVLVVARMLADPGYAGLAGSAASFRAEVLAMHRRVTSLADVRGRLQPPWPRALGTPPWAVARQLEGTTGLDHRIRFVRAGGRDAAYDEIEAVTARRLPVPVYVGNRWLPRHVVLALGEVDGGLRVYEPSAGRLVDVSRASFLAGTLDLAGWDVPWFSLPARPAPPAPPPRSGRRTPA